MIKAVSHIKLIFTVRVLSRGSSGVMYRSRKKHILHYVAPEKIRCIVKYSSKHELMVLYDPHDLVLYRSFHGLLDKPVRLIVRLTWICIRFIFQAKRFYDSCLFFNSYFLTYINGQMSKGLLARLWVITSYVLLNWPLLHVSSAIFKRINGSELIFFGLNVL